MKKIKTSLCLLALSVSTAHAGGFENARLDTSFMYDEGNLVSLSAVNKNFEVTGSTSATTKSVITDRAASAVQAKYQVSDTIGLGIHVYESGALHLNYQGAGGVLTGGNSPGQTGPKVTGSVDTIALLANYRFNDSFSALVGVKRNRISVQNADIFKIANPAFRDPAISSDSNISPLWGLAYEVPDIALRAELVVQSSADFSMQSECGVAPVQCDPAQSKAGVPDFMTFNFQTGIAKDTLAFGSIHKGKWSKAQISISDNSPNTPTSAFEDSTEYSIGIGRKFSDNLSGSISYNWEPEGSSTTTSLFTVNNGYKGVSLGVKYALENFEIAAGYNYTKLGDVTYTGAPANNTLTDNSVTALGAKVTIRF